MDKRDRFILAPLAGYTDKAFREICSLFGSDSAVSEMVSAEGLARGSSKTEELMEKYDGEKKLTVQLFAPSTDPIERALPYLIEKKIDAVDLNCGCPVPKVVKTGCGSALMKSPETIGEIVKVLKKNLSVPVSIKIRLGWDSASINFLECASRAVENGVDAITLHARTRAQGYSGKADREAFGILSNALSKSGVSIYASGDIFTPEDALEIIASYSLRGVMFARGAIGNPFIFRQTREYIEKGTYALPTVEERIETAIRHYDLMVKYYGENTASHAMRKHAIMYVKGIKRSAECKNALSRAGSREDYIRAFSLLSHDSITE